MAPRLIEHPSARVNEQERQRSGGRTGHHVASEFDVPRAVGDDETPPRRPEVAIRDVDRDPLLALVLQPVRNEGEIEAILRRNASRRRASSVSSGTARESHSSRPDQRRLAVVHAAGGHQAKQFARMRPSEIAFALLPFHRRILVVIDQPVLPFRGSKLPHLFDDFIDGLGLRANRAGAVRAADRSHPAHDHLDLFSRLERQVMVGGQVAGLAGSPWGAAWRNTGRRWESVLAGCTPTRPTRSSWTGERRAWSGP